MNETELQAKIVISGTLVYHDKDGQEVGRADFTMPATQDFFEPGVSFPDRTAMLSDAEKASIRACAAESMTDEERAAVLEVRESTAPVVVRRDGDFH